jgi:hypothetical protein
MVKAPLCEFLLNLATDPKALKDYTAADPDGRVLIMKYAGLSEEQWDAVLEIDEPRITAEIVKEIEGCAPIGRGNRYTIQLTLELERLK